LVLLDFQGEACLPHSKVTNSPDGNDKHYKSDVLKCNFASL